jgi:hypothetical protein
MKHIFISILLFTGLQLAKSQNTNSWVYKVNFQAVEQQGDTLSNYTDVYMDMNPAAVFDSATLVIAIGSDFGARDIYSRGIVYTSNIVNGKDITNVDGAIRFYLGRYAIRPTSPFIVDLAIKPKGSPLN